MLRRSLPSAVVRALTMPLPWIRSLSSRARIVAMASLFVLAPALAPGADQGRMPLSAAAPASPDEADPFAAQEIRRLSEPDTDHRIRQFAMMVLLPGGFVLVLVLLVRRNFLQ